MKFKTAIIGILIATLIVGTSTAIILIQESKKQTKITLEILQELKKQNEIAQNTETESKKQTETAIKIADLLSIQIDITADAIIMENLSRETEYSELTNSAYNAAFRRAEMEKIRKSLGLDTLHNVSGVANYQPSEEIIDIVRPDN